jgi:hypothetical protein
MFKFLGLVVGIYTIIALISGSIKTRAGLGGRTIWRKREANYYWLVVAIYSSASIALLSIPSPF